MFALSTAIVALAASVAAAPHVARQSVSVSSASASASASSISSLSGVSFDNWGGFNSLNGFDSFYGSDNFCGNNNQQTILSSQTVVCQSESITLIQQQMAILLEFAKRVVTTEICEVEVQTIVWTQVVSQFSSFSEDLQHISGRSIGYDSTIASYISDLVTSDDEINTTDFNFQGLDIGQNLVVPSGSNWDSSSSQISVQQALLASQSSSIASSSSFTASSSLGHSSSFGGFGGLGGSSGTFDIGSL